MHYAEHGSGTPVLALHGAGVDHREIAGALEPIFRNVPGFRRLYPDLPGMGRTPAPETISSNDDVLDILLGLIDSTIGDEPLLVMGQSYGGYLARAVANRRPEQVVGLALICPVGAHTRNVPRHEVLVSSAELTGELGPELEASYRSYFVVQTAETLSRFQEFVAPAESLVDESGLTRIFSHWELRDRPGGCENLFASRANPCRATGCHGRAHSPVGAGRSTTPGLRLLYSTAPATRCCTSNPLSRRPWLSNGSRASVSTPATRPRFMGWTPRNSRAPPRAGAENLRRTVSPRMQFQVFHIGPHRIGDSGEMRQEMRFN